MGKDVEADWLLIKRAAEEEPKLVEMMFKMTGLSGAVYPAEKERSEVADWLRRLRFDKPRRHRKKTAHLSKKGKLVWLR